MILGTILIDFAKQSGQGFICQVSVPHYSA